MKKVILFVSVALISVFSYAQKKTTTSAVINFDASTPIDELPKAENKTGVAMLNTKKGEVSFEATIKNFSFTNPVIQDHFNGEKWMNSDKFPTAVFKGKINNASAVNFTKEGTYSAEISGDLTIKGIAKPVSTMADIVVGADGVISTTALFNITLADYGIEGGAIKAGKVDDTPSISVSAKF
jgi:polyisoprenoid-binding protein YceI